MVANNYFNKHIAFSGGLMIVVIVVFIIGNVKVLRRLEETLNSKTSSAANDQFQIQSNIESSSKKIEKHINKNSHNHHNASAENHIARSSDAYIAYGKYMKYASIVDEISMKFLILPSEKCEADTKLVILVNSRSGSPSVRSSMRRVMKLRKGMKMFFLVGRPLEKEANSQEEQPSSPLNDEAEREGDLIVPADIWDNYESLTVKTGLGLLWVLKFCPQSRQVLKVDDDVFVNLKLLEERLSSSPPYSILGKVCTACIPFNPGGATNERENLLSYSFVVTRNHIPLSRLPPFVFGPSYVITTALLPVLLATAMEMDSIPYYEDLFWTGLITTAIKEKLEDGNFNLLEYISILKLEHRHKFRIKEILDFIFIVCNKFATKFALSLKTLSLMKLLDVPFWRVEYHKCEKNITNNNCSKFITFHGVSWSEREMNQFHEINYSRT